MWTGRQSSFGLHDVGAKPYPSCVWALSDLSGPDFALAVTSGQFYWTRLNRITNSTPATRAHSLAEMATRHNARHRSAQEFRAISTRVPKRSRLHVLNRQCLPVILKHAAVR